MAVLSGALTARRYHVIGGIPEGFRALFAEKLTEHAFRPSASRLVEARFGWVMVGNMLESDFSDLSGWLAEPWAVFMLRIDKPVIPVRLIKATLAKQAKAWCKANGVERCPRNVKQDLKEQITDELVRKMLPRTSTYEVAWHLVDGWMFFGSLSKGANDTLETLFKETFGLSLAIHDPLLSLEEALAEALAGVSAEDFRLVPTFLPGPTLRDEVEIAEEVEEDEDRDGEDGRTVRVRVEAPVRAAPVAASSPVAPDEGAP